MRTHNTCTQCIHIENWDFEKYFNDECLKSNVRISEDAQMRKINWEKTKMN